MSQGGGATGLGTIFSLAATGGTPTVLYSFDGAHGAVPYDSLTLSGSTLYGPATHGGDLTLNRGGGVGTIFSIPVTGGTPTVLHTFEGPDGEFPCDLTLSGSTLFGMTAAGGAKNDGTIFALHILPGDANGDGQVDINDLTIVLANFGQSGCAWSQGCMDNDPTGTVDVNDLTIVLANFGDTFGAPRLAATPEPAALVLLLAALVCLLARRPRLPRAAAAQTSRSASGTYRAQGA
jgi:uncharacterized repeat protein (TIGR03803 family)